MRSRVVQDILSSTVGGTLIVRIPEFEGTFEIGAKSDVLRRVLVAQCYEPKMARVVKRWVDPARDVIDVGSNIGFYTVLASQLVSENQRVLSIEPTPGALKLLRINVERNARPSQVIIYEGAATSATRTVLINIVEGREEYSSTGTLAHPATAGAPFTTLKVDGSSIDDLVNMFNLDPGFMKIDTEGTEYDVLLGSKHMLAENRPIIMFEMFSDAVLIAAGGIPGKSKDILTQYHYYVLDIDEVNYLAIPEEQYHKSQCWY